MLRPGALALRNGGEGKEAEGHRYARLMELDDGFDDDEPVARWLPPDDRLWRHPSEVAANPWPTVARSRGREPRMWTVALLAGVIGSLLTTGLIAVGGG